VGIAEEPSGRRWRSRLDGAPSLARDVLAASGVGLATRGGERGSEDGEDQQESLHGDRLDRNRGEGNTRNEDDHIRKGIV
jgi:hypothetical protein